MPRSRTNRFLDALKKADGYFQLRLKPLKGEMFGSLLNQARDRQLVSAEQHNVLRIAANVRNVIVHDATSVARLVVPTLEAIHQLEATVEAVTRPRLAIPTFERQVEILQSNAALSIVLELVRKRDYSQFPVYRSGKFFGLLTENGITRWLAAHVSGKGTVVALETANAGQVLVCEENEGTNVEFAPRDEPVPALAARFKQNALLEAVLVTKHGDKADRLLGIATRWDVSSLGQA